MARYRTKIGSIMVDVYEKQKELSEKCALVLLGFPATLGETSLVKMLANLGYAVLVPHYPGTYDSGGEFTPHACIEMVDAINDAVRSGIVINLKNEKESVVPNSIDLIVGYSFGAFIGVHSQNEIDGCCKFMAFSPAVTYGVSEIEMGFKENGREFIEYIMRTRPYTYRFGDIDKWQAFYAGDLNIFPESPKQDLPKRILAVIGENDSSINSDIFKMNANDYFSRFWRLGSLDIKVIPNAGHSIDGLLTEDVRIAIRKFTK